MSNPHKPNDKTRSEVSALASVGVTQDVISDYLGIDEKTLRKYYRTELDHSAMLRNAKVANSLYNQAMNGSAPAAIFWLKCRAGWKEQGAKTDDDVELPAVVRVEVVDASRN